MTPYILTLLFWCHCVLLSSTEQNSQLYLSEGGHITPAEFLKKTQIYRKVNDEIGL